MTREEKLNVDSIKSEVPSIPTDLTVNHTTEQPDLMKIFLKFDSSAPISKEILYQARSLCAEYLGGVWNKVEIEEFKIRAITGGMSNLLFLVELPDHLRGAKHEPERAVLRIYCQSDTNRILSESVVFTYLSEQKLGPKMLGVFPGGRLEQYIPSRNLQIPEFRQPRYTRHMAPIFAKWHTLDVPIRKSPQVLNIARGWLNRYKQIAGSDKTIEIFTTQVDLPKSDYPSSITVAELEEELNFVEYFLVNSGSPVVFAHNDLHAGNVLLNDGYTVAEDGIVTHNDGLKTDVQPLTFIDFEFCSYNYRGFDLGNHFTEYGFDYTFTEPPYYKIHQKWFEVDKERDVFCEAYLNELYKMHSSGDNSHFPAGLISGDYDKDFAQLKRESILFMAVANMFWSCWAFNNEVDGVLEYDYTYVTKDRLALYFHQKKAIEQYLKSL